MGYPVFGKVRTIVLPSPDKNLTIDEYKNLYGIDLRDILKVNEGTISIPNDILNNSLILIRQSKNFGTVTPLVPCMFVDIQNTYESGVSPAFTLLATVYEKDEEAFYGIVFTIDENTEFSIDNVKVYTREF